MQVGWQKRARSYHQIPILDKGTWYVLTQVAKWCKCMPVRQTDSALCHYLNRWWTIVNRTLGNNFQWNWIPNMTIFDQERHLNNRLQNHYNDVIMSAVASQITGVSVVYSTVCSGADEWKYESSVSLAFVRGIHRWTLCSGFDVSSNKWKRVWPLVGQV